MIYLIAILASLLQIALGGELKVMGGIGYYLPALIILSACVGDARRWLMWWLALVITAFFVPLASFTVALLVATSALGYLLLERWINYDNPAIVGLVASGCIALFVGGDIYLARHTLAPIYLGSLILTLPVVIIWFSIKSPRKSPL